MTRAIPPTGSLKGLVDPPIKSSVVPTTTVPTGSFRGEGPIERIAATAEPPSPLPGQHAEPTSSGASKVLVAAGVAGLALLLVSYLAYRATAVFAACLAINTSLAWSYAAGLTLTLGALLFFAQRSLHRYRRLLHISGLQRMAAVAVAENPVNEGFRRRLRIEIEAYLRNLERVAANWVPDLLPRIGRLRVRMEEHGRDPQRSVEQLEEFVLAGIDETVDQVIKRRAYETAVATALASGVLDPFILLSQTLRMINDVSSRYGSRPGWLGTLRLLRRGLAAALFAELAEQGTELLVELAATKTAASLGGRAAQGTANGLLMLRLGDAIKRECRPVLLPKRPLAVTEFVRMLLNRGNGAAPAA
jgi:putative membrane protein